MKEDQEYIRDIARMRSMMERSSKFLALSGLAGIMAGIYALAGAFIAYKVFDFNPVLETESWSPKLVQVISLAVLVLILSIGTAAILSYRRADKSGERIWNATTRRLLLNMIVPLIVGGLLIIIMISKGLIGLIAPFTLLFYGLALFNASKYTYDEMRSLGIVEIVLGLISSYFVEYALLFWALGFGVVHIIYGVYVYYRYEK